MAHAIRTKQLKTAWKRSGSDLSFRQWCKLESTVEAVAGWHDSLSENVGESWDKLEEKTTPKVDALLGLG